MIPAPGASIIIRIFKLALVLAGATTLTFKDTAGNALWGANGLPMLANGSLVLDFDTQPWFTCAPGAGFIINSSANVSINGGLYYSRASAS
jgi:hypothetical protein